MFSIGFLLGCGGSDTATAPQEAGNAANPAAQPAAPQTPDTAAGSSESDAAKGNQPAGLPGPSSENELPAWAGQRQDEPFDVKQFLASRAAPAENAAPLYLPALAQISGDLGNENGSSLGKEIGNLADIEKLAAGTFPAEQVERVITAAAGAVQLLDAAQSKPHCVFVTGLSIEANLAHVQAARSLARLSVLQLHQAGVTGNFGPAEAAIKRCLRMSRDLQPRGSLVCQLVSISIDGVLFAAVERLTLNDPRLTPEQCDRLLSLLIEHQQQGLDRVDEGLRVEYIVSRNSLHDLQAGRLSMEQFMESVGTGAPQQGNSAQFPRLNYEAEIVACNRLFAMLIEEAKRPITQVETSSQFRNEMARLTAEAKAATPTMRQTGQSEIPLLVLMLVPGTDTMADANRRGTANLAGLQMLVALRRYELKHGYLPPALDAAAAETALKTIPVDPYGGAPLRFALVAGKPTVYSIGKDLKDDGGQSDWKFGTQPGDSLFALTLRPETKLTPPPVPTPPPVAPKSAATTPATPVRVWTSTAGTTMEAELVNVQDSVATLKKRDGSILRVPLSKLSDQDQQWIRTAQPSPNR